MKKQINQSKQISKISHHQQPSQNQYQNNQQQNKQSLPTHNHNQIIHTLITTQQIQQKKQIINNQQIITKPIQPKLSKKQQKKLKQKQKWKQIRKNKRISQKQKKKITKLASNQSPQNQHPPSSQKKQQSHNPPPQLKKKKKLSYQQKMQNNQQVIIDLQFYDLMTQKQQNSLCKQLAYCHSINRKLQQPFNFILTSATCNYIILSSESRIQSLHQKYSVLNYGITILKQDLTQLFDKNNLIYLTGDANQQLTQLKPSQIYIIGGIVDHNRLKNITINYANKHGIKSKRLPMQGIKLKSSTHLAVNHVWQWMLRYYNGSTWNDALKMVLPQRKIQNIQNGIQNYQ